MLGDRMAGVPGSVVVPVLQGRRPLLVEVQALLGPGRGSAAANGNGSSPRPQALGLDASRANLLLAVLSWRTAVGDLLGKPAPEFFVAAVGGISVSEPAADLAIALAMASIADGRSIPPDLVAFGELGLAGEVRTVPGAERRLAEARRAGFSRALVPASTPGDSTTTGVALHRVRTLSEALDAIHDHRVGRTSPVTMPGWSTVAAAASR
jgi:DNA repair protein RadA/Sms